MGKHPKLTNLESFFKKDSFSLTEAQYEQKTGVRLPKDTYYLLHKSALAKKALEEGYSLSVQEKIVTLRRVKK